MKPEWFKMGCSALAGVLLALALLMLDGCAPYPRVKYAEMDAAVVNAETKEEAEWYVKFRDKFEAAAIKADAWFLNRELCLAGNSDRFGNEMLWVCSATEPDWDRRLVVGIDARVRAYRMWHHKCGCVDKARFLDSLGMGR